MSGEPNRLPYPEDKHSLAELQDTIPRAEQDYASLWAATRILRDPKTGDDLKIAPLVGECHIYPDDAPHLLKLSRGGQLGFRLAGYTAAIHPINERRNILVGERNRPSIAYSFAGGAAEDSAENDRISVFLSPAHQPERIRTLLTCGFVFKPARQCFFQWHGKAARSAVTRVPGVSCSANHPAALRPDGPTVGTHPATSVAAAVQTGVAV